ncbi:hypothetical protein PQX77_014718 [Marasmius sp. AFHP31]|nr:hypothetical protein PQX77_014718 [Marasmius sp. AFHP31]
MEQLDVQYPRRVMVDDTDPRITYDTGFWDFDGSTFVNYEMLGDPYNKTMTGTNSAKASFTFTFEGDYVQVRGARDNRKIPPPSKDTGFDAIDSFPKFSCQIDDNSVASANYATLFKYYITNVPLCEQANLSPGSHTLTMNVTVENPDQNIFWLDSIEYSPLSTGNLTKQVLRVYSSDPRSWMNTENASMSFKFSGTSVSLYGMDLRASLEETPHVNTAASYRIDGAQSVPFTIPGSKTLPSNPGNATGYGWYNQRLFTSDLLDGDREHEIVISYAGTHSGMGSPQPLLIDYFLVTTDRAQVGENVPVPQTSGLPGDGEKAHSKFPIGGVVGGIIGGIFTLIVIATLVWALRRRRRQSGLNDGQENVEPFDVMTVARNRDPVEDSQSPEGSAVAQTSSGEPSSANLPRMNKAQRGPADSRPRQEVDSGLRYSEIGTSLGSATLPPVYTPD